MSATATFKNLTAEEITEIAEIYGFDASDPIVIENAKEADDQHGVWTPIPGPCVDRYSHTYRADLLLESYLCETARCAHASHAALPAA